MEEISQKEQRIIRIFFEKGKLSSSDVHDEIAQSGERISLVTVKRLLSDMAGKGLLTVEGAGRSTVYRMATAGRVYADTDALQFDSTDPDRRYGLSRYNFDLFAEMPVDVFNGQELMTLEAATKEYAARTHDLSPIIKRKELERLIIELSWKSSKIEGNTYTLLDTEKLILEHKEATGHDKKEARMILNHKDAFSFIHAHADQFKSLTRASLEQVHNIIVHNLGVNIGLRTKPVGVVGSKYQPLDNEHHIREAVESFTRIISNMGSPYAKALMTLLGISYIQPFEDGNKRTARLMANAVLLAHGCAPLSYRSVDERAYRAATLVFYELNSIMPFKKIFIEQYDFAARNYAVK